MKGVLCILSILCTILHAPSLMAEEGGTVSERVVSGVVRGHDGSPRSSVDVQIRAVEGRHRGVTTQVTTDADGVYTAGLGEGVWIISACGSSEGFEPAYWRVRISQGDVEEFEAVGMEGVRIDHYRGALRGIFYLNRNRTVTLKGSGFGCSGKVLLEMGDYGQREIREFEWVDEETIRFTIPLDLFDLAGVPEGEGIGVSVFYINGRVRSNPVRIFIAREP